MNKTELIDFMANETGMTKASAHLALDAYIKAVQESLVAGEKVQLSGFGTFYVDSRAARIGRNPRTGQNIAITAKTVAKFKPGKELAQAVL